MTRYIITFILAIIGSHEVLANNTITETSNQSHMVIILGIVILCAIFFMLIGKQKRRYND